MPTSRLPSPASIPRADRKPSAKRRRLVSSGVIKGLKLDPLLQQFFPNDPIAYPLYKVFAEAKLPVLFHTGHSGIGTNMPGDGGIRLNTATDPPRTRNPPDRFGMHLKGAPRSRSSVHFWEALSRNRLIGKVGHETISAISFNQ